MKVPPSPRALLLLFGIVFGAATPAAAAPPSGRVFTRPEVGPPAPLAGAIVYVTSHVPGLAAPSGPFEARIVGGELVPAHPIVVVGQNLAVRVVDRENYSLWFHSPKEPEYGRAPRGGDRTETFTRPADFVHVRCDIHPRFAALVTVVPNAAFARTGADGRFALPVDLPPGRYDLKASRYGHGKGSATVEVRAGPSPEVDLLIQSR